jgi:hypothetical protein
VILCCTWAIASVLIPYLSSHASYINTKNLGGMLNSKKVFHTKKQRRKIMSWCAEPEVLQKSLDIFQLWLRRANKLTFHYHSYSAEELYDKVLPKATSKHTFFAILYGPLNMFSRLLEYETTSPAQKEFLKGFISRNDISKPEFESIEYPTYLDEVLGVDFAKPQEIPIDPVQMLDRLILLDFASVLNKRGIFGICTETDDGKTARGFIMSCEFSYGYEWGFQDFFKTCLAVKFATPDQKGFLEEFMQAFPNAK